MSYSPDNIRAAAERTIAFFQANPDKRIKGALAENEDQRVVSPFAEGAQCFCWIGRIVHELGPLEVRDPTTYEEGYTEAVAVYGDRWHADRAWKINDNALLTTEEVLEAERELLREAGVLDA